MRSAPLVSVVCATFNRPEAVARLLDALAGQDLDGRFEVLLSDDGSPSAVLERLRSLVASSPLDVRLLENGRNRGACAARNAGWRAASAPSIAFTDDDCRPDPSWLRHGLAALETSDVVVGAVRPDPDQLRHAGPWARTLRVEDARYFQTANVLYRRDDLDQVGGFDERFVHGGEDTDLGMRVVALGRRAVFDPHAAVVHDVREESAWSLAWISARRWRDLPLVVKCHPQLRVTAAYRRWFWKRSHPPALVALLGLLIGPFALPGSLLVAPYLWERLVRHPPARAWRRRLRLLPGAFLVDVAEVVACVRGSARHRTLLL